jgi:acetyltransferase
LKLLLDIGRKEGLERIIGHILPDNYGMQRVCKKLGFALNYDDFADDMRAEITL